MNIISTADFTITNVNPQIATIYAKTENQPYTGFDANNLVLDFGKKTVGDITVCNLIFESDVYTVTSTGASCGCTRPTLTVIDERTQQITVDFDSSKITKNVSKWLTLTLNNNLKTIKINLVINKP